VKAHERIVYWGIWILLGVCLAICIAAYVALSPSARADAPHFRLSRDVRTSGSHVAMLYSPVGSLIVSRRAVCGAPEISRLTHDLLKPHLCADSGSDIAGVELQRRCNDAAHVVKASRAVFNFRASSSSALGGLLGVNPAEERSSAGQFPDRGNFSRAGSNPAEARLNLCGLNFLEASRA
jgi:hypothetical protein